VGEREGKGEGKRNRGGREGEGGEERGRESQIEHGV